MRELSLFTGAGGGLLGTRLLGWNPACYVERDPYCQQVLRARMADGAIHTAPIHDDVRTFDALPWRGRVDVVTAGFPCQPFSVAGRRRAGADERNGWPDTARILREVRPRFALLENVPGLVAHTYFGTVLGDLAESGFDAEWDCFSAASVGAPHIRDRLWILAYARCEREHGLQPVGQPERSETSSPGGGGKTSDTRWWGSEPAVGRVAHGVAHRMDRLRAIGNGQVPPVVVRAWRELSERMPKVTL